MTPDQKTWKRFRCLIGYEIKNEVGLNFPDSLYYPSTTYFGPDKRVFLYINENEAMGRESQFYLKKFSAERHGRTFIISPDFSRLGQYMELGFIFEIPSSVLELQFVHKGMFYQQIAFDGEDLVKFSGFLFKMLNFSYAKVNVIELCEVQRSNDVSSLVLKPHGLKRYSILIDLAAEKYNGSQIKVTAKQRYLHTDVVTRTAVSDCPNYRDRTKANELLEKIISEIPFIKTFNEGCLTNKLLLHSIEFHTEKQELLMNFSIPGDLSRLMNSMLYDALQKHQENTVTITQISNHEFCIPS